MLVEKRLYSNKVDREKRIKQKLGYLVKITY